MKTHLFAGLLLLGSSSAHGWAANIVVTSTSNNTFNDGVCTLREAITAANNNVASGSGAPGECVAGSSSGKDTSASTSPAWAATRTASTTAAEG